MVSGITGYDNDDMLQLMLNNIQPKLDKADTDGINGLSADELASIDAKDDGFLKTLKEQFSKIDTDSNGQITTEEIKNSLSAQNQGQMGPPAGMQIQTSDNSEQEYVSSLLNSIKTRHMQSGKNSFLQTLENNGVMDNLKNVAGDMASSFVNKLISNHQNGGLSTVASSVAHLL